MKQMTRKILALSLLLVAFVLPLTASADGDAGSAAASGSGGLAASGTYDSKNNTNGNSDCVACNNLRQAGSPGGTVAEPPNQYTPGGGKAGTSVPADSSAQ